MALYYTLPFLKRTEKSSVSCCFCASGISALQTNRDLMPGSLFTLPMIAHDLQTRLRAEITISELKRKVFFFEWRQRTASTYQYTAVRCA